MATVVLLGTLDTKGEEYSWLRSQLEAAGCEVITVDVGSFTEGAAADARRPRSPPGRGWTSARCSQRGTAMR